MERSPQRFGDFELLEVLGGSMGIVYRARRVDDATEVALKVLRHDRLLDGEARVRFDREVAALARLRHPNICPLLESGIVDGVPYLCMPLLSRRPLTEYRDANSTAATARWRDPVALAAKVALALAAAHDQGIVHRDVKPSNILLDDAGEPRLLDFGLAQDAVDRYRYLTRTGQVVGTPNYLAPEQIDSRFGRIDARTDVYGLGAVLFELLTGERAFAADAKAELFDRILRELPPDPRRLVRDLPEDLAVVLDQAMARRPKHRYASARDLAHDLHRVLAERPIAAGRPSVWQRAWRRAWDRPREAVTALGLTTSAALLLAAAGEISASKAQLVEASTRIEQAAWLGRLELARSAYSLLPPPRENSLAVYAAWLHEHARPLGEASAAIRQATVGLEPFLATATADVQARIGLAEVFHHRIEHDDQQAWATARSQIEADPRFDDFRLSPQWGLVPLGSDPKSGLQEFYDLASGDPGLGVPTRDGERHLALREEHGIVFVLLPGGSLTPTWPAGASVTLAPFLLAKHELTRAQHRRLDTGRDDSRWPLVEIPVVHELQTVRHPVDQVLREPLIAMLQRWGLELPDQVQWEFALRVGGAMSLAAAMAEPGNVGGKSDGFAANAPVGSFPANGFGLHDMVGNVGELVATGKCDRMQPRVHHTMCGRHFGAESWLAYSTMGDQRYDCNGVRVLRSVH